MHTLDSIKKDLEKIGVKEGDTLFIRVSYKSIGEIKGGPLSFLIALRNVVGSEGTIIMTAFPKKYIRQLRWFHRKEVYSKEKISKPTTGIIPVMALSMPESRISEKLEFPFVVIGKNADYLTTNHTHEKYSYWLLKEAIERFDCKCLRVGGEPFLGSTHIAFDDVLIKNGFYQKKLKYGLYLKEHGVVKWYDTPNTIFCRSQFMNYVDEIVEHSKISEGKVGDGIAIITNMKKSLNKEREIFNRDIYKTLCDNPNCLFCRTSFSYSDETTWGFIRRQVRRLGGGERKDAMILIKKAIENKVWGVRVQ